MRITTKALATKLNVEYIVASGLIRFLEAINIAKMVDKVKSVTGKGKPSAVYEIPDLVTFDLATVVAVAPVEAAPAAEPVLAQAA